MNKVLFVAAEGLPFIKSGGLADVIGSLPKELKKVGYDVRVIMPLYEKIAKKHHQNFEKIAQFKIGLNLQDILVSIYTQEVDGVIYYFVENQYYFERDQLYGYPDDGERFSYFQLAVLEMLHQIDYFPDVMHCHDWHTGMIPALCRERFAADERYRLMKQVYTIHNLAYQGNFPKELLQSCLGLSDYLFDCGAVRFDNGVSFMKSAIVYADKVTTVSPSYAQEILTTEYGEHLEHVLQMRHKDLVGILNGIDIDDWNPAKDTTLVKNYNKVSVFKGKAENKLALQKELGLVEDASVMMLGVVTRLANQKGLQLIIEQMSRFVESNVQLVILGSGEKDMENIFDACEAGNKGKVVFYKGYNESLAHRIYASCDAFLMPSRFEPCGLSQMISLRYGTLPIVRETGGLKDSVLPYNQFTKEGTGFTFSQFDGADMMNAVDRCLQLYYEDPKTYKVLIRQAMKFDVSWEKSAKEYAELYKGVIEG